VKITTEQLLQAARNTLKPPQNRSALLYKALQHVRLSAAKRKPAASAKANGLNNITIAQIHYGPKPD